MIPQHLRDEIMFKAKAAYEPLFKDGNINGPVEGRFISEEEVTKSLMDFSDALGGEIEQDEQLINRKLGIRNDNA